MPLPIKKLALTRETVRSLNVKASLRTGVGGDPPAGSASGAGMKAGPPPGVSHGPTGAASAHGVPLE